MHEHSIASHSKLWLIKRESQTNNKHTVSVLCQKHDFILLHDFFDFLIGNLIHFFLLFIAVTGLKIITTTLIPGTKLMKNGSSFPPPRLLRAPRLFGREEKFFKLNSSSDLFLISMSFLINRKSSYYLFQLIPQLPWIDLRRSHFQSLC